MAPSVEISGDLLVPEVHSGGVDKGQFGLKEKVPIESALREF